MKFLGYRPFIAPLVLILFFISPGFAAEEKARALTLEDCINAARENNELIKIQTQRIGRSRQKISQASGTVLPDISFAYQSFARDTAGGTLTAGGTDSRFILAQPLFHGLQNIESIKAAVSDKYIEELRLRNTMRGLDSDVAGAFYLLEQAESDLKNTNETLEAMLARKKELSDRVRLGKSRENELYMLDSQIAVLNAGIRKLAGDRDNSLETLSFLIGLPAASIALNDTLPEPGALDPVDNYIEKAASRADILAADESVAAQSHRLNISKGGRLPTLDLTGSWYSSRSSSLSAWDIYLLLGVPIYQGGILKSKIGEETAVLRELRNTSSLVRQQMRTEIRLLHISLQSSIAQVALLKDAYTKSQKSYELQLMDYRLGIVNNLDVIQAALTLLDVKNNLDKSVLQAKLNQALLDIAVSNR